MNNLEQSLEFARNNSSQLKPFILISGRIEEDDENTTLVVFEPNGDVARAKSMFIKNLMLDVELEDEQTYDDIQYYWEIVQPLSNMLEPGAFLLTDSDIKGVDWEPKTVSDQTYAPGFG